MLMLHIIWRMLNEHKPKISKYDHCTPAKNLGTQKSFYASAQRKIKIYKLVPGKVTLKNADYILKF
jgi:hypothetical protein